MDDENKHMKHLLHIFPTFAIGGSQMRFGQLVAAHGARYRHTVISLDGERQMQARLADTAPVHYAPPPKITGALWQSVRASRAALQALKPDTLVTYNWGAMNWCLANLLSPIARHIHIEDGFGPEERHHQLKRRVWTRRVALSGRQTTVIVPSRTLETIARSIWRLPAGSIRYIPNGIDCRRFGVMPVPHDDLVIGTVATLRREKNLERLIGAFAALAGEWENLRLLIVGDGPERAALEAAARQSGYGARIHFAGASSQPEIHLAQMDIFALSSDTEQMPLSLLEAMAAGLPVASLAVGDVPNMVSVENQPYVLTSLQDERGYRQAIQDLLAHAELRGQLGSANRQRALEMFDEKIMAERYAALFG